MNMPINPIAAAFALTPHWMRDIQSFDAIEVHPCHAVGLSDGHEIIEQCEPDAAEFWSVYGHRRAGGLECFEDFPGEAEAEAFAAQLRHVYPHLALDLLTAARRVVDRWEGGDLAEAVRELAAAVAKAEGGAS